MVEIADIKDRASLKVWLAETNQSREASIWLAHRAAMRVLPVYWHWVATVTTSETARNNNLLAWPVLRANLTSGVACKMPTAEIRTAAARADSIAAGTFHNTRAVSPANATSAARAAAAAVAYAANVETIPTFADPATLKQDCQTLQTANGVVPETGPALWQDQDNPFADTWRELKTHLPADWHFFWTDWYDRALEGRETRWDLLERIALSKLPKRAEPYAPEDFDAFWERSDAEVNGRINAIWEEWKAARTVDPIEDIGLMEDPPGSDKATAVSPMGKNAVSQQVAFLLKTAPAAANSARFAASQIEDAVTAYHQEICVNISDEGGAFFAVARCFGALADAIDEASEDATKVAALEALVAAQKEEIERLSEQIANMPSARSQILIGALGGAGATAIIGVGALAFGAEGAKAIASISSYLSTAAPTTPPMGP